MSEFLEDIILPEDIKPLYKGISGYLINVNYKWRFYKELFLDKNNSELFQHTAFMFFSAIEESFRYDIILAICRLSDPARSKYNENLSLETIIQKTEFINKVNELYQEFINISKSFRKYRHKIIAHNDLEVIEDRSSLTPLLDIETVDKSLVLCGKILNLIAQYYHSDGIESSINGWS
jgi:phosphoenolpyruvate carboxylase